MNILTMLAAIIQNVKRLSVLSLFILFYFGIATVNLGALITQFSNDSSKGINLLDVDWMASAQAVEETVGDNFPSASYSQNSGSKNWVGDWIELGESNGTNAGFAQVHSGLCTSGNCLRLGVTSGNSPQDYDDKGVYREVDLGSATSATLSFVYRSGVNSGSQTVKLAVYNGSAWVDLESFDIDSTKTSPTTATFNLLDYVTSISSITRIRFLASGKDAVIGMYIDDIEIKYEVSSKLSVSKENVTKEYEVSSYGGSSQDISGTVNIQDAGSSLSIIGNRWQKIDFSYTVTENTVIEFDFKSDVEGEIQGLGFDTDLSISADRSFKVYGTQNWGISNKDLHSGSGVTHFEIPVGEYYTGNFQYLFFINDDDSNPTGESLFSNINVYEKNKPLAVYHFNEAEWNGTPDEVIDSSGNGYHGRMRSNSTPLDASPALTGNPGTCGYASQSGGSIEITGLPLDGGDTGLKTTVAFWMYWNGIDSVMPIGWHTHDIWIQGGFIGFNTGNSDLFGVSSAGLANGWHHVAVEFTNGSIINNSMHIDGVKQVLSKRRTNDPSKSRAIVGSELRIGGWSRGSGYEFQGSIDEVRIYQGTLTTSEVNVIMSEKHPCPSKPFAEYRFDELNWDGTPNEVLDNSGNNYHGTAIKMTTLPAGKICAAGDFSTPGTSDYLSLANTAADNLTDFTVSVWAIKNFTHTGTILSGANSGQQNEMIMFFPNNYTFRPYIKSSNVSFANNDVGDVDIGNGEWHHLVWTRRGTTQCYYVDGAEVECGTISKSGALKIDPGGLIIGQEQDALGDNFDENQAWDSLLDELIIFNTALPESEIKSIFGYQDEGKNYDGSTRNCPVAPTLLAEYRFEGDTWDDTPSVIIDNTGNGYHGKILRDSILVNPAPVSFPAALTGNPGTCGYAKQSSGSIQITGLDFPEGSGLNTVKAGEKTTVTFWMKWDGSNSVMPIGWYIHDIWMVGGNMGFNTGGGDLYGISSAGLANGWHHVAVEFTNGSVTNNKIYIDGEEKGLSTRHLTRSPNPSRAFVNKEMRVGGWSVSTNYDFQGLMDEVRIYKGALTTEQVVTIMNERHDCSPPSIHHYEIVHDGQGLTCEAESYTVKACTDETCSSLSSESVTLNVLADGNIINNPTFTGTTTVSFNHTVAETLTLSVANTSIDASDPVLCKGGSGTSCDMVFADTGFKFYSSIDSTAIPTQLSAKPSNVGFNASTLKIQAIKKNTNTGACQAALIDNTVIEMAATCVDPIACASQVAINNLNSTTNITPLGNTASLTYSPVTLNFGNSTSDSADFIFIYPDAGKVKLHARYNIRDGDNNPTGNYMLGSSLPFVVRPFGFFIDVLNNPKAQSANQANSDFIKAGENFTTNLSAVQWQAADDDLLSEANDGIPDSDADLSNNTITANFGNEIVTEEATIDDSLYLPNSGIEGNLTNVSFNDFTNGVATNGIANSKSMTYSEVGIVKFSAKLTSGTYLGAGDITGVEPYVGRFIPDHFELSTGFDGSIISVCDTTSPSSEAPFAYTGQVSSTGATKGALQYKSSLQPELLITAKSSICQSGVCTTTQNYTGDFMKLEPDDIDYIIPLIDAEPNRVGALGTPLKLLANMNDGTLPNQANGVITYAFNTNDNFVYIREQNSERALFPAKIELGVDAVEDLDGVVAIDSDGDVDNNRLWVLKPEGTEIRFGRVSLENSFGPETSPIGQVLSVEYFDGTNYVLADTDTCTQYNSTNISFGPLNAIGLDSANIPAVSGTFTDIDDFPNGVTRQIVLPPVAAGNQGKVEVTYTTYPWLQYDWHWNGVEVKTFDENPSAIATYGLFRGNDRIIYSREVFNP